MLMSHQSLRLFKRSEVSVFRWLLQPKRILGSVSSLSRNFVAVGAGYSDEGKQITDAACKTVTESKELSLPFLWEAVLLLSNSGTLKAKLKKSTQVSAVH